MRFPAAVLFLALSAAGAARAGDVHVAVAANFASTLNALAERFEEASGDHVLVSVGSTGQLYAQIDNGAPFELFFAADVERPRRLEDEGAIVPGTRFTYAIGRIALWSPRAGYVDDDGNVLETGSFRHLAIANPELAPYGAAARDVLRGRGLWERLQSRIVQGQDIGQTYSYIYSGNAELGFVALSQLEKPGKQVQGSYWLVPQPLYSPIEQQAVLLKDTPAARAFVAFVKSNAGLAIIRSYGYGT